MLRSFFLDESGQASVEYVLMLSIVVTFLLTVGRKLIKPAYTKILKNITDKIEKQIFGVDMHFYHVPGS